MKDRISLYGGFLGNETSIEARDSKVNVTIIDATGLNTTTVTAADHSALVGFTITGGNSSGNGGGVYCPQDSSFILDDCTISGNLGYDGGGVYCATSSSVTLMNCTIERNLATQDGGGAYCAEGSSVTFENCMIIDNSGSDLNWNGSDGGGVFCMDDSSVVFTDCTISGNAAAWGGGVIGRPDAPIGFNHCTISNNYGYCAGGVFCWNSTMTSCIVAENTQEAGGCFANAAAGVTCGGESTLIDCTITGNVVLEMGETGGCIIGGGRMENCTITNNHGGVGGLLIVEYSNREKDMMIENCTINDNTGYWGGGGVRGRRFEMVNCTIMGNTYEEYIGSSGVGGEGYTLKNCNIAENSGGDAVIGEDTSSFTPSPCFLINCIISKNTANTAAIYSSEYPFFLTNCVVEGNSSNGCNLISGSMITNCILWNLEEEITGHADVTYSCIQDGYEGEGNIDTDPLFTDAENGDYHLQDSSPCIDAGLVSAAPTEDVEGRDRPGSDGLVDIGAYESPPEYKSTVYVPFWKIY